MKVKFNKIFVILFGLLLPISVFGQNVERAKADTPKIGRLMNDLKIDQAKALAIIKAMHYKQTEIDTLLKSRSILPAQRSKLLIPIFQEREKLIKSVLTPDQYNVYLIKIRSHLAMQRIISDEKFKMKQKSDEALRLSNKVKTFKPTKNTEL